MIIWENDYLIRAFVPTKIKIIIENIYLSEANGKNAQNILSVNLIISWMFAIFILNSVFIFSTTIINSSLQTVRTNVLSLD